MKKLLVAFVGTLFISLSINAQGVTITEKKVEEVIEKMENSSVELIEVKTMKKYKALVLSNDMKEKMGYHVIRVKYKTENTQKTILIDMNLVPIEYDYAALSG